MGLISYTELQTIPYLDAMKLIEAYNIKNELERKAYDSRKNKGVIR